MSSLINTYEQGAAVVGKVTLFEIDLTQFSEGTFYIVQGAEDEVTPTVTFGGQVYTPHPIEMTGADKNVDGPMPRPRLKVGNHGGIFTAMMEANDDLKGGIVRKIVTYEKFLDNGAAADSNAHRPIETYIINKKIGHSTRDAQIDFELAAAIDQEMANLPRGTCLRDYCPLIYRVWDGSQFVYDQTEEACPYTGSTYFDGTDTSTTQANDNCSKRLTGCEARFGTGALPFGGFPGMSRVRIKG